MSNSGICKRLVKSDPLGGGRGAATEELSSTPHLNVSKVYPFSCTHHLSVDKFYPFSSKENLNGLKVDPFSSKDHLNGLKSRGRCVLMLQCCRNCSVMDA